MRCNKCLHENEENALYCIKCGNKLNNNHSYNHSTNSIGCGSIISLIFIALVVFLFVVIFIDSTDDMSISPSVSHFINRAKSCEDSEVKNLVLQIFKENNRYYKSINKNSIKSLSLIYPAASRYDKDVDKYYCTGTIIMEANPSGFLPNLYDYSNDYYYLIHRYSGLIKYSTYKLNVEYESQISEGNTLVRSTTDGGDFNGNGGTIVDQSKVEEERKRAQKKQKEINDTHMNLPD